MPPVRSHLLLCFVLLFALATSAPIACCAGTIETHGAKAAPIASHCGDGGGCCERAASDPQSRHCCQGGDTFERPHSGPQPAAPVLAATVGLDLPHLHRALLDGRWRSAGDPILAIEPLYTLHASLLI